MTEEIRVIRIVVPARDLVRVADIISKLNREAISVTNKVKRLFDSRPDLDSIEYVFTMKLSRDKERILRRELSKRISGTIGFFLIYKYNENE